MSKAITLSNVSKKFVLNHDAQSNRGFLARLAFWDKAGKKPASEEDFWALKNLNLTINEGDVVGIIGANGAGKSTLLKLVSQIYPPTEGTIEIHGRLGSILEVGMGFHTDLSGIENIRMSGTILGMTPEEVRKSVDAIIDFADIGTFIDVPVKYYSSGMYMRLAFAVCAFLNHEILVLDEVLAVGDAAFQRKCLGKMHHESSSGRTLLFVSHNMSAINSLCNRCLYLKDGEVIDDGEPHSVIQTYMETESAARSVVEWDEKTAPGNELYRLRKVSVVNKKGDVLQAVANDKPFYVEITYDVMTETLPVGATIVFYDNNAQCLFGTLSNQDAKWHGKKRKKGAYTSRIMVPKDIFNQGIFYITVLLWTSNYSDIIRVDEAIELEVMDTGEIRGDYFGRMEGPFLPRISWETKKVD